MAENITYRREMIRQAIFDLKDAREHLRLAGAPRSLAKVRSALKSAEGAYRHADRFVLTGIVRKWR